MLFPILSCQLQLNLRLLSTSLTPSQSSSVSADRGRSYAVVTQNSSPSSRNQSSLTAPKTPSIARELLDGLLGKDSPNTYNPYGWSRQAAGASPGRTPLSGGGGESSTPSASQNGTGTSSQSTATLAPEDLLQHMKFCLCCHNEYTAVRSIDPEGHQHRAYLREIRLTCRNKYKELLDRYIKTVFLPNGRGGSSTQARIAVDQTSTQDFLDLLNSHQIEDLRDMCQEDEWTQMRVDALAIVVELVWCGRENAGLFSKVNRAPAYITADMDKVNTAAMITINLIRSISSSQAVSSSIVKKLFQNMIIPLIRNIPAAVAVIPMVDPIAHSDRVPIASVEESNEEKKAYETAASAEYSTRSSPVHKKSSAISRDTVIEIDSSDDESMNLAESGVNAATEEEKISTIPVILFLERGFMPIALSLSSTDVQKDFFEACITKKISIRQHLPGYSTCIREFLLKHTEMREMFFQMFFPVLHENVPPCDSAWVSALPRRMNYQVVCQCACLNVVLLY